MEGNPFVTFSLENRVLILGGTHAVDTMVKAIHSKYILPPRTQVRREDFGLLFYTMDGPRLYFLSSGELLESSFFEGAYTLDEWIHENTKEGSVSSARILALRRALDGLREKGVVLEC